jgi:hypothetical protein
MPYGLGVDNSSLIFCRKGRQLYSGQGRSPTLIGSQIICSHPSDYGHICAYSGQIMTIAMVIIVMVAILMMAMMMV